ncbi:MAG: FIST C-terminal domain-containing protein, partial [Planctomycetaceae bacterium]|nr:FIST C-terminal domain-containing protein [Planctomycetaceae bacterium]
MITMFNAFTNEIDEPDIAVKEITEQLKNKKLLKNTVGIIACHYEYIENGIIGDLSKILPFDLVGCVVQGSAINGNGGLEQLSLTVLTSDDIVFTSAISEPVFPENFDSAMEKVYAEATQSRNNPSFIFVLGPITVDLSGSMILKKIIQMGGEIPIFGTLSNDTSCQYEYSYVFRNGEYHVRKLVLLLLHGDFRPRFYTTSVATRNIQQQNAIVTDSSGYLVKKINHLSVLDYFKTIGVQTSELASVSMLPFVVDFGDGTIPAAYSLYNVSEQGAYCGGEIPVGSTIAFAEIDYNSVMETAENALHQAFKDIEKNNANGISTNGMIAIPCFTRSLIILPNMEDEIKKSLELVGDRIPFSLIYSGGEICPIYNKQ